MKAVAASAEYFDNCQSSSPRQGPGANSFSLLSREIQSVLFYTSIFNIINFQVFVNTEFMKDTGNTQFMKDTGNTQFMKDTGTGWTDQKTGSGLCRGTPLSGCRGAALRFQPRYCSLSCRRAALPGCRGVSLRSHSGISSGHRDVITDLLHAKFHASAAFRRFVAGTYFSVIKEVFAPHISR